VTWPKSSRGRVVVRSKHPSRVFFAHLFAFANMRISLDFGISLLSKPLLQYTFSTALTDFLTTQVLESWTERAVDVMILTHESVLSCVAQWVEFVAPMASKVKPSHRRIRCEVRCKKSVRLIVVRKGIQILHRVPQRATVRLIVQNAARKDIRVGTGCAIHGMRAGG
jgi:hypothetical protein